MLPGHIMHTMINTEEQPSAPRHLIKENGIEHEDNGRIKQYPKSFFDKQRWQDEESVMKWILRLFGRDFIMSWIIRGSVSLAPKLVYLLRSKK